MSSYNYGHLDGNAAAGELSNLFAVDITAAEGRVHTAVQQGHLLRHICIWTDPA